MYVKDTRDRSGSVVVALVVSTMLGFIFFFSVVSMHEKFSQAQYDQIFYALVGEYVVLLILIWGFRWKWQKCEDLRYTLGEVEQLLDDIFTQKLVDAVLERPALVFYTAIEERAQYASDAARGDEDAVAKFDELETVVLGKRRAFWEMHVFFKSLGFKMRRSFKDYLPKKLRGAPKPKRQRHRRSVGKAVPAAV